MFVSMSLGFLVSMGTQSSNFFTLKKAYERESAGLQRAYVEVKTNPENFKSVSKAYVSKCEQVFIPSALKIARASRGAAKEEAYLFALRVSAQFQDSAPEVTVKIWDELIEKTKTQGSFEELITTARLSMGPSTALAPRFSEFPSSAASREAKASFDYAESLLGGGPNAAVNGKKNLLALIKKYPKSKAAMRAKSALKLREGLQSGKSVPSIVFKKTDGQFFDLSQQKGKVVVVDFWGFWCPGCVEELPELKKLRASFPKDKLEMLSVSTDSWPTEYYAERAKDAGLDWNHAIVGSPYDETVARLGFAVYPAKLVIDQNGIIRAYGPNYLLDDWISKVSELLSSK